MKHMNNHFGGWRVPMAGLQLFAEGDGDEGGTGDGNGGGDGAGSEGGEGNQEPLSFDDFLKGEGNQAEFDRRVQKAVNTAVSKAQAKWKALTDDGLSEAEKLARMTKEEKAEYEMNKLKQQLAELQKQTNRSDMAKTARKLLEDEEVRIPDELIAHLVADDAEGTKTAVESFAKLFKEAVQSAVKDQLKGKTPKSGSGKGGMTKEQILKIKDPAERQRLIGEHMDLFITKG